MISFYPTFSSKRITAFLGQSFFFFLVTCGLLLCTQLVQAQTVKGTVYRDFNNNSTKDNSATFNEVGVAKVLVCAYKSDGSLADSTRTAADGTYTLNSGAGQLRIEFKKF